MQIMQITKLSATSAHLSGARRSKSILEPNSPRDFWNVYRPLLYSKKVKQANDINLKENNISITDKKEMSELFNNQFVHTADGVAEINEIDYGEEFIDYPSIKAIHENINNRALYCVLTFNAQIKNK